VAVVGCGRIAQVMHLPFLQELPQFEIAALVDVSRPVLEQLARRYAGASLHLDHREALERPDVDVVAVLTPDHAAIAEDAARRGKHLFVEKPLCFAPAEGRRLREAVADAGVCAMVGYMRRYDPAFRRLLRMLPELGPVQLVRARDVLGLRSVPTDITTLVLPTAGENGRAGDRAAIADRLRDGVGSDDPRRTELYWTMLMLATHDLAVLRGLLGSPSEVTATELIAPQHLVTALRYADGARVTLEVGVWPGHTWSETLLDVVTASATASLSWDNPWVRHLPTSLVTRTEVDGETVERHAPPAFQASFREEWLELDSAIAAGREPETGLDGGLEDVELAGAIVAAIPDAQLDAITTKGEI